MGYADAKYGVVKRVVFPNVDAIGTAAVHPDEMSFAKKSKIVKFGIVTQDNDVRASSLTQLDLVSGGATIATFVFPSTITTIGTDTATGVTVATTVAANAVVQGAVGVIGSTGNFQYYIDVKEQFDATAADSDS